MRRHGTGPAMSNGCHDPRLRHDAATSVARPYRSVQVPSAHRAPWVRANTCSRCECLAILCARLVHLLHPFGQTTQSASLSTSCARGRLADEAVDITRFQALAPRMYTSQRSVRRSWMLAAWGRVRLAGCAGVSPLRWPAASDRHHRGSGRRGADPRASRACPCAPAARAGPARWRRPRALG